MASIYLECRGSPQEVPHGMESLLDTGRNHRAYLVTLMCCMDERDRVQKKTFTKWINQHLLKVRKHINDLYEDLRDGHNLISLLEVLSGDTLRRERDFLKTLRLVSGTEACAVEQHGDTVDDDKGPRERGRMRFHRLQNVQIALDYLKRRQVKLVNIRNDDITDGNPKLTLGLIWTIILHFQISEIHVTGESEDMTAKERLLLWSKQITDGYVGVRCDNFTTSWRDGRLFNAIIHKYRPDLVDMSEVSSQTNRSNLEQAFCVAEQLGVARLLDPEDVDVQSPDEKSVITYVSTLYDAFPKVPDGVEGINPNDVDIKWVEYQNMIKYLSQWLKHNVAIMSDRSFPNNPAELKALYTQYLQFKEHEIPLKENEKTKIKNLYKMLEMWIEFGRLQLPLGHHPNDVEKEWGKLIVAMLEREKSLRPEVERLEMLQQIANRVQRDCVNGEDKLALAKTALQSDAKRLESGIQFLNEAEIASYLLECENILRQQVVDIQILLDGKFPFADQLVQRVSKLRDDLLTLRAECSSVYSKGRTLTTEQTKRMISGITQSLNSGFSQNMNTSLTPALTPALTSGGLGTPGSTFTSSLTPSLTPSLPTALTPSLQPASVQGYMGSGGSMEPGSLMHLKHMQIRKPLLKSSLADPNMTEEEVNMKYVQDLLNWVEEMQLQLERSEWGSDLPSVELHLENHKSVHRAIEEFQISLKDAKLSEIQMTIPLRLTYSDKLNKLEKQYERLLTSSRERQNQLESLHDFVSQATQELIWLNEKEEEEVAFDWSDRNSNISTKRDYHADLMRELDEKEEAIKSVQDKAERLMLKNHPARLTIEAYKAAMQTQWSWILQLCSCVEQHLKENAVYLEYFSDAKETLDYLKSLQDSIKRKYSCDQSSSLHRLEDLIQESMDEKEQLLQYRSTVASLVGRAKNIVQLKPRNPESPLRSSIPVKAICDYRQIEITIYKDDECVLANNSHRAKWKVINPSGNEAMVPSVCFTVPPPNKEAVEMATRTEQLYQNVLSLWHHSHINMKSVVSWHYLMADIRAIRNWNVASIKTMLPGEHQQVLSNLQSHFDEFLEDSEESEVFTMADCAQLERDEHEESAYNHYISEIRNFRMHLEAHEEHLIRQIRTPLERDDVEQSLQRITEHEKKTADLERLREDLDGMKAKCELFLRQAAGSPSVPMLSSELSVLIQSMSQVSSMSSIYMDKLKTVSLVVKHSQSAEAVVKAYESKLYEEDAMNSDIKSIESVISTLKQWRTEIDEQQEVFHDMEDELQRARVISDRMFKAHNERDFDLDWHKEKADQLSERWQNIHSQIDSRLRDLDGICKSLKHYRDSYCSLNEWVGELEALQLKTQENKPDDSKALAELLNKQKVLVAEIEQKQSRIDECQKYSEQYSSAIKDYELQLMTFRAMVDSQHKSPLKKRRMQSSSDAIQQEFMDLRTRYTALVTLMTQYVKFASETLRRTEDEESRKACERAENAKWTESVELQKAKGDVEIRQLKQRVQEQEALLSERQAQVETLEGEVETQKKTIDDLTFQNAQLEHDVNQYRTKLEIAVKDKAASEQELKHTKLLIEQSEATCSLTQKKFEDLLKKHNDGQDLHTQSSNLQRKTNREEADIPNEEKLCGEVQPKSNGLAPRPLEFDSQQSVEIQQDSSAGRLHDALQQKLEEVVLVQKKAEMAEEKAQSYKKLLDESNNRLKKLQMDMESEKIRMRQKAEDLQQETGNLKKSVSDLQEEIRSLQRAKSSLEQSAFFQNTEVEGLKEQLKITHGELQKKTSIEQENSYKMNSLEEELSSKQSVIDQLKFKCSELTRMSVSSDSDIRSLQIQMESLEKERSLSEQKIKSLKREVESWKEQFQTSKEENLVVKRSENMLNLKCKNLEAELQKSEIVGGQLQRKIDDLKQINLEMDQNLKNVRAKLEQVTIEIESKDQQIKIFKSQVESTKSQIRIIEEEVNKKSQTTHELQMKLQDFSEEAKKMADLEQKIKTLNSNITNNEEEKTRLKSELKSLFTEKSLSNQKIQMQKAEINDLNEMLKKKNAELQKESDENQKHLRKIKALEEELFEHKHSFKGLTSSAETLKREIYSVQTDKTSAERKIESLNLKLSELSSSLQRTINELAQETKDRKSKELKIMQLETELHTNNLTIKELMSNSDRSRSNLQHENTILKREKSEALEKTITLGSEVRLLKDKLQRVQMDAEQKQKENSALQQKSQQMEEQLQKCKMMLEELKSKLELQKEGYERQLSLVQTEIQKKIVLLQSDISKESQQSHGAQLSEVLNRYFKDDTKVLKTVHHTMVEQQVDRELQIKMDRLHEERAKLGQDLSKAKLEITQLETDKLTLTSKISTLQSLCNQQAMERTKYEKLLGDSERKLVLKENEAKALREQIELHVREVKILQESLSTFKVNKVTSHQYATNNKADTPTVKKMVPIKNGAKEVAAMEGGTILEGIKQVEDSYSQTLSTQQKDKQHVIHRTASDVAISDTTHMAGSGLTGQRSNESNISKTRTYQIKEVHEVVKTSEKNLSECERKGSMTMSRNTLPSKWSTNIQYLIKYKLLDGEVLRKLEMGLITMEEMRALLPQQIDKPTAIAGVYVDSSKKKMSFLEAAEKGFLAKTYALEFLEAQAATGSIKDLASGQTHSVPEALERGIIDATLKDKLMEAEKAISGYNCKGKKLSLFQAMEERILDRYKGKKILEVQVATGGLINPENGVRVPVHLAVEQGLLNEETLLSLFDPVSNPKGFHNPDTGQKAYYSEILRTCLYDMDGGVFLFPFGERHLTSSSPMSPHRVSVVDSSCGSEMSAYEAFRGKHIDKRTYLFLSQQESEWQERSVLDPDGSTRHIVNDARSGRQICLESALSQRFLEASEFESYLSGVLSIYEIADIIFSRMVVIEDVNSPIAGLWDITQRKRLSVLQGFQQGFTDRGTALRLLESQACTGGICDPSTGEKFPLSEALKKGLVDEALSQQLQQFEQVFNGIIHPKSGKTLIVPQAVQENLLPKDAGFRCVEFQLLTGGLINPITHDRLSLEEVIQSGAVDKATATVLKDENLHAKSLTCPKTKRRITFKEALERSLFDCHTGLRLLEATKIHGFGAKSTFHYRSIDEEKREHGDKVSKLLHWMSDVKRTMSNDGNSLKDSNANTDASNKPQVSVEEMVTKKEQIAEALRSTQMMLSKHSDKMADEDVEQMKEQLNALSQAYSELSQQCSDQTASAEEISSVQDYLECVGRLQDHADVLEDVRKDLSMQTPVGNNMEDLQMQTEECQSLESELSRLGGVLTVDMDKAKQLLNAADEYIPEQIQQDLASTYQQLEPNFTAVSQMCAERRGSLIHAMEVGKAHLESEYQEHLCDVHKLSDLIQENLKMLDVDLNTCDLDTLKQLSQQNKDSENSLLKEARLKLEDVTFDIQCFISEHAQFLSPAQSSYLLKYLTTTQRAFRDHTERLITQQSALDVLLDARERENQQKNQLIGHQQQAESAGCVTDLQQYQQEHQALQKDVLKNASALNEVITSTAKFLEENRSKLTPDQIAMIESKLEEAKSKAKLINQRAEESRKDLEKVVTTAIKQESEKAAAVEQLEESKNKIEGLLDWISNIGNENKSCLDQTDHISQENGNLPEETSAKELTGEADDANGNALQTSENDSGRETRGENAISLDLDKHYDRLKAHHEEILSQQQDLIMATQSAQALLEKQASVLSPEEKERLQKNIQDLRERYEASLTQAEQQMKQVQCVQEELKKFQDDCGEFEGWLGHAEGEIEELGTPAASLNVLRDKLLRQKSFSEDVISHKGDLRFITISGQKVLDVAKACGLTDPAAANAQLQVDTSGTCSAVKDKLDSAANRYKTLHSQCNLLGNNLKEALQGQMVGHQTAVDTLRKTAELLVTSEGNLLSNPDDIQETVDDIVERYDNLSKSVSDRNEKLQITLTRSMSVQDGLDEMMTWMEGVEASVKEKEQIPLDSASIGDTLSKEAALEQDIAGRQSSISAIKAKVLKFVETADPSAATLLQTKMDTLSQRFTDACDKHKQKVSKLEQLKEKVEEFENTADKVQQSIVKRSQDLHETDGPGKTFSELSELMQNAKAEMAEYASDMEKLQTLSKELSEISPDGNKAQLLSKLDNVSNIFSTFKDTVKEKEEELSSCQDQLGEFRCAASALTKWLEESNDRVPAAQPSSSEKNLEKDLQIVTGLLNEWTSKGPAVQDLNSKGAALCSLITFLTSPAKAKTSNKSELMGIQQNMSFIGEGYTNLGETLKSREEQLSSLLQKVKEAHKETEDMMSWLRDMKKTAASWNNAATEKDAVKTQLEQQKAFEDGMKQRQEQLQKLREKLLDLITAHPNSPEAAKWKQMLAEIDAAWGEISGSVEERKQHLEQSNKNLDIFQRNELQLGQWLSEKELMMSVLGPLSIDPNMLKMQKQQVQILQNEFKSRKPQYEQLEEAASVLLNSSDSQEPSSGKLVREQLAAVNQKWQCLTGQLDQRDSLIDQAVVKTGQFQELLKSLGDITTQLENQLTNHHTSSTQPDAVKKQLEDVQSISAQLREEKKKLKQAEAINAELTAMVTEDYLKADLTRQLESVSKPFKQLEEKAAKRIEQLNSTFASSQQFHQTSKDFQSWLGEKLQDQLKPLSISAKADILQQTLEEHSKLQKALKEQEQAYSTIIGEGEMLLHSTDGAEKLALQGQLTTLSSNWEEVKRSSAEQAEKLQEALLKSQKYQAHSEKLSSWIQDCEGSEGRVKLAVDPAAVESSISQVKALQKDVDKHRGLVEQLNTAAESLMEVANTDTEDITEEKESLGKRVEKLAEGLQTKRESLEKISHTVKEFNDAYKEANCQLEGAKKQVDSYELQGAQAHSNKNLTNIKTQQKSLEGVQNQVEHMKALAQDLVCDVPDAEGVTDLLLQTDSLEKDYSKLNKKLEEACEVLESKLQGIGQFQNRIREMFTQFAELDDELDSMSPMDLDLTTLKEQQDSIQSFLAKLRELMANTANAGDSCKKMLEAESSPDLMGLKRDLDALSKQCGKLLDRANGREAQVQSTLTKLDELYGKLHLVEEKLRSAVDKEASQETVGMETDVINQQLEAFKAFQKEDIDPLQTQLQDINLVGNGLIQNAAKGTSTKKLEEDLEGVNWKWNTLNKKIAERSAQLHEALLHCGRFQDALESLLSWLTDTEELVASQKPPSAEFKVVKAQIQEQKLLQRLLDDRKPTVELIKKEGGKVSELAESVDKEKVAKEIECLGQRWDALLKKADNRHKQLESILVVTQQFHETLEPLSEWLTATEKHLANSDPVGTETSKLEDQISQHKALEEEIMNHSKDLFQAVNLGQMLKSVSSVDEKEFVQSKLDTTQANYIELQERCRKKADMLQQALANAQLFGEDEVALMNWLNEVHPRLSEVSVEDYKIDILEKQLAEQRKLQSDEVVVIQAKLDGIKTKYAEINSMSDSVLKTLERVLDLSTKLQHTHKDLNAWLDKAEAEIKIFADEVPMGEQHGQTQTKQKALLKETKEQKPVLGKLNELSNSLLDLIPWHAREGLDKLVTEDNERYRAVCNTITQQVDQINADILRSQQFEQALDTELSWLTETERKLLSMGEIRLEQDQTAAQLQAQKIFSMDIMRHKDAVDDIVKVGKAIMTSKTPEEKEVLKAKIQALMEKYGAVSQLNSERCLQLERAHSLALQFWETYEEMWPWLQETLNTFSQLPPPAIEYETLRQQQEELRQMRELIAEHKPHIDKMNKTGPQLLELSSVEGVPIREKYTAADQLYTKLKADVTQRAATLDEAISKSTQFHDKIDPMLESLERIAERLRQPPSISVELDKIKEQITENKSVSVDLEKLQPSYETLKLRGEEMIARSEGADKDISAKAVQDKLDHMVFLWNDIQALLEEREAKLLDVMDLADKFWCDHCALIVTIKDSQDLLKELEEPGVDPSVVKQQQEFVEGFKEEIDGLQEELDVVRNQGAELMTACGEPDKPVIKKSVDEVNSAWENLNKTWKERVERLEEAMQAAVQFQDGLQGMFDWVDILESKLDSMSPVGTDLETVKQQIGELKEFKGEAYQLQIEMERLNHQAGLLLKKVTEDCDRCAIQEPMSELKMLLENMDEKIISRQHKLEGGLLALGQFQHALDELLAWMSHTEELLDEQRKAAGDPKAIEIELAKHHVLQIDVLAHKSTVETVNKAGNELVESSAGEEASSLQSKLENLNQRWKAVLEKTAQRKQQLEASLLQAQGFHGEIEDMQQWLKDTERQLLASKAVGGLPDTAREQLNAHLELCSAFEAKEDLYQELLKKGHQLLVMMPEGPESNTEQDLTNLKEKWEAVQGKVTERKAKLEEALTLATDFHNSLQDFIVWLTQAEQTLNMVSPASLILETILFQIDEHKMFVTEVNSHREHIIELDKTGTHLKYFSQKQDVVLIKNLLLSVQGRWEKLVQRSVERGRLLDDARKRAKQFHETFNKLMEWLDESEKSLDSEVEIANDPDKIKTQLAQHKEFQKALGSKHSVYDTTSRTGRALKDKTSLQDDNLKLDDMLSELRDKWDTVCGKSIERQNKLEEALLFSGQFTDALQALIDWLYRVEPQLAEDQPVHGDIDLVLNLIDNHKAFQKELGKRTVSVQALKRSAKELIESSHDDSSWVKVQMQELSTRWETVCNLSVSKQVRLEQALCQEFMKKLEEKRAALTKATSMGEAILSICHPDSITTIKHWNTIIKARFEEVQAWARQHQQRMVTALTELLATQELLEKLLTWLQWAETNIDEKDREALPQEIEDIKSLIAEHQAFMEEMTRKQPDVDKITKTHKRKAAMESQIQSQIPVLDKGRAGRKRSPTQTMYASSTQPPIETKNPRVNLLVTKWQHVWLLALDRRRKLNDALDRLEELKEFANFDFDVWRKRYMRWMNHKKSRVMDFFRRIDKDQDGKVTRQEFIEGILSSKFPTSRLEMSAVADIFDRDGDGYIDYYEFVAALHPNKDAYKPLTDADKIEDEVTRQVAKCKCPKRFQVEQIGANKYRFYLGNQFGDSQQLRLVRILRSTVMVRVGGGWMALDEFLVKNDPCRVHHHGSKMLRSESNSSITQSPIGWQISNFLSLLHEPTSAKGRTNVELREKFILPEGTTQVMASFRYRGRRSRPSSRGASPNRSTSSQSCPVPSNPTATSTPKTSQHITRNYDKPWLTNSKPSTPLKSSDSFGSQGSSSEGTAVQGSKLRLPGYLSGKGFQSGEEGTLINAAVLKARTQMIGESRKNSSRPGSKAGSRGSSRRGSDASDFDISDIQSVCSDVSETVGESTRGTPRSASRQQGGKPSKIPTPQRRTTPSSKLTKGSKR
ncbi:unnamed protein product [Menidia menidia]|uniref:(Atlantic silverside) hypothetical protein n=1 Tax=Menidia menidia TaxID=238744 RepID=A0A8S4BVR5_9TELE|nr:unnamed protein product [Menidia menidia]